jgi:hypothetical protein
VVSTFRQNTDASNYYVDVLLTPPAPAPGRRSSSACRFNTQSFDPEHRAMEALFA